MPQTILSLSMGSILIHARSTGRLEDKDQHSGHRGAELSPRATPPGAARRVFDRSRPHFRNGPTVSRGGGPLLLPGLFSSASPAPLRTTHSARAVGEMSAKAVVKICDMPPDMLESASLPTAALGSNDLQL